MEEITLTYYVKTQQFKMKHLLCVSTRNKCLHCTMPSPRTEDLVRTPKSNWVLWHIGLLVIPASATWKVGLSGGQGCPSSLHQDCQLKTLSEKQRARIWIQVVECLPSIHPQHCKTMEWWLGPPIPALVK